MKQLYEICRIAMLTIMLAACSPENGGAPSGAEAGAAPASFELVILNGRVIDPESGLDANRNVLESFVPQMQKKGRLQVGMDADIAVFDPERVAPVGTYAEPYHPAVGVEYVLVMGTPVVDGGAMVLDAAPGQPIRRSMQEE